MSKFSNRHAATLGESSSQTCKSAREILFFFCSFFQDWVRAMSATRGLRSEKFTWLSAELSRQSFTNHSSLSLIPHTLNLSLLMDFPSILSLSKDICLLLIHYLMGFCWSGHIQGALSDLQRNIHTVMLKWAQININLCPQISVP